MKFKRLMVKGFMRFKEQQEVIFPENQITLIFGENGAGKTSLLDAICIALYGKTFRTSLDPEVGFLTIPDLVNRDSTKASIHIEFENYGHNFVVKREITRDKSEGELLEDGEVKAQGEDVFSYVTKNALGLDWKGFTKSTVILQGEMNTLTSALSATRKETFVKLFWLDKYADYELIARLELERQNVFIKELETANEILVNDVTLLPKVTNSIKHLSKEITKLEQLKTSSGKQVKRLTKLEGHLDKGYKRYIALNGKVDNVNKLIFDVEKRIKTKTNVLIQLTPTQSKFPSIKKAYGELVAIINSLKTMRSLKVRYEGLQNQLESLKGLIREKNEKLESIQDKTKISGDIINKLKKQIPSPKEVMSVKEEMTRLNRKKVELEANQYQFTTELNVEIRSVNELKANMIKIESKRICPICKQKILDTKGLLKNYTKKIRSIEADAKRKQSRSKSISLELKKVDQKLGSLKDLKNRLEGTFSKKGELIEEFKRLDTMNSERNKMNKEIVPLLKEIDQLKKRLKSLGFDVGKYNSMEQKINSLTQGKATANYFDAQAKLKQLPKLKAEVGSLNLGLSKMEKERKNLLLEIKKLRDIENRFSAVKEEFQSRRNIYNQNLVTLVKEQTNYKALTNQLIELKNKETKLQNNEDNIEKLRNDASVYEDLILIFRKIPENILKRVVPFVEKESTAVINELSEHAITAINIDSEKFDIRASMGGEVRPLQYFSGGQQTRINLALRVAISRILSRMPHGEAKALDMIQTIFIDEGDFGNLDEAGVRDTVGVLNNLIKGFSRVILISHLDSVRNSFQGFSVEIIKTTPSQSMINTSSAALYVEN